MPVDPDRPVTPPARPLAPVLELTRWRFIEMVREPEALFWMYGFPLVMTLALGFAFRDKPADKLAVTVVKASDGSPAPVVKGLPADRFTPEERTDEEARKRLRAGKTPLAVAAKPDGGVTYTFDPDRPEALAARQAVDDAVQRAAGRKDPVPTTDVAFREPGGRYVDFLVPGLLGMGVMGGGLFGVGYTLVDLRIRRLLKRFLATPMSRRDFLLSLLLSQLLFLVGEVAALLLFAYTIFGVTNRGGWGPAALLLVAGAVAFGGVGLLVAARAKTVEAINGLLNLVTVPMYLLSGVFFSSERFPAFLQPLIQLLPLTALVEGLRAVTQEGAGVGQVLGYVAILLAWAVGTFALAARLFRWA